MSNSSSILRQRSRPLAIALTFAVLGGCGPGGGGGAQAASGPYSRPGELVALPDGRQINLRCSGRGSPRVILESGFGAMSGAWRDIQPAIARTTSVCSYDRAGAGFSAPGPLPRDGAAIARDLDEALSAAGLEGPYVVVGHSAGGFYSRLFAARRPGEVKGLVLVDPSVEHIAAGPADGLEGMRRRRERCAALAEAKPPLSPDSPQLAACGPDPAARSLEQRALGWRGEGSELDAMFHATSAQVMRLGGVLKDVPAYVLTASDTAAASQQIGYDQPQSVWELSHVRMALGFERGYQRTVLSSHRMMADRPEVVIDAILAMVTAARAGTPPEPLAISETAEVGETPAGAFPRPPRVMAPNF